MITFLSWAGGLHEFLPNNYKCHYFQGDADFTGVMLRL